MTIYSNYDAYPLSRVLPDLEKLAVQARTLHLDINKAHTDGAEGLASHNEISANVAQKFEALLVDATELCCNLQQKPSRLTIRTQYFMTGLSGSAANFDRLLLTILDAVSSNTEFRSPITDMNKSAEAFFKGWQPVMESINTSIKEDVREEMLSYERDSLRRRFNEPDVRHTPTYGAYGRGHRPQFSEPRDMNGRIISWSDGVRL